MHGSQALFLFALSICPRIIHIREFEGVKEDKIVKLWGENSQSFCQNHLTLRLSNAVKLTGVFADGQGDMVCAYTSSTQRRSIFI